MQVFPSAKPTKYQKQIDKSSNKRHIVNLLFFPILDQESGNIPPDAMVR